MKVGFTGTLSGMTPRQLRSVEAFLSEHAHELHHGAAIGADAEAHTLARKLGIPVVLHPPVDKSRQAKLTGGHWLDPLDYLARNHAIVDATDVLIAAPKGAEILRSGTWATVRYARKMGKEVWVMHPR